MLPVKDSSADKAAVSVVELAHDAVVYQGMADSIDAFEPGLS